MYTDEKYGPYLGDYRRWLWAQIQAGADLETLATNAPAFAAPVVATGRRRQAAIERRQKVLTGPGPDARRINQEVR